MWRKTLSPEVIKLFSDRRNKTTALIGILVFLVTIFLFFILTEDTTIVSWVSLIFIIVAEIGLFGGLIIADILADKSAGVMMRSGINGVLSIYAIVSIITSIVFMINANDTVKALITIQIVIAAVSAILIILITSISKSVGENSKNVFKSVNKIQELTNKAAILQDNTKYSAYKKQLEKVLEAIKYCDNATTVETDDIVSDKIAELERILLEESDNKDDQVTNIVDTILLLMKQRAAGVKNIKSGGF